MNELVHAILQHTNAMRTLQNPPAGYVDLPRFEESGRKFVIADDTFRNKISELRHGLVRLIFNSKVVFFSLIGTIRFQAYAVNLVNRFS
jgi:enolase